MKKIIIIFLFSCTLISCRSFYLSKSETSFAPPSSVRIKFYAEKRSFLSKIFGLKPVPYTKLDEKNFSIFEDNTKMSKKEAQFRIKKKEQAFKIVTMLLLDNSISIGNENLIKVKDAAKQLVQGKSSNQVYAIAEFSGKYFQISEFSDDKQSLLTAIDKIQLGDNSTNLYGSITQGLKDLGTFISTYPKTLASVSYLIVLTDGSDTQGTSMITAINQEKINNNYTIITLGVKGPELNRKALKEIADKNFNYQVKNYESLSSIFKKVTKDMITAANAFYSLEFLSPKREAKEHKITLQAHSKNKFLALFQKKKNPTTIKNKNSLIDKSFNSAQFYSASSGITCNINDDFLLSEKCQKEHRVSFGKGNKLTFQFMSIGGVELLPKYSTTISDGSFKLTQLMDDLYTIEAIGEKGTTSTIRINDQANSFNLEITLEITK